MAYLVVAMCFGGVLLCIQPHLHILALLLWTIGVVALAIADLRGVLALLYPSYALGGVLLSSTLIESGVYVTEQFRYGWNIGATPSFAAYALGFLAVAHIGLTFTLGRNREFKNCGQPRRYERMIVFLAVATSASYLLTFLIYGLGASHPSRFDWLETLPPVVTQLTYVMGMYAVPSLFALAGFYWMYFKQFKPFLLILSLPVLMILGTGEKFGAFLQAVILFVLGVTVAAYMRGETIRVNSKAVATTLTLLPLFYVMLLVGYTRMGAASAQEALEQRIALQGHVWFGIFEKFDGSRALNPSEVFGPDTFDRPSGLNMLSLLITDPTYVRDRLERGITFTMGGSPSVLGTFGFSLGLVLFAILGLSYVAAILLISYWLQRSMVIPALASFAFYILVGLATQMGRWHTLLGSVAIAIYLVIAAYWLRQLLNRSTSPGQAVRARIPTDA